MNDINLLKEPFRSSVRELLDRAKHIKGIRVTETLRTIARQRYLVSTGKSKTITSKHLTGEAVDIYVDKYNSELYEELYKVSKDINYIVWPYRDKGWNWDMPHFEYDPNKRKEKLMISEHEWFDSLVTGLCMVWSTYHDGQEPYRPSIADDASKLSNREIEFKGLIEKWQRKD